MRDEQQQQQPHAFQRVILALAIAVAGAVVACQHAGDNTAREASATVTATADPAYETLVKACDAAEGAVIASFPPDASRAEVVDAVGKVRKPCLSAALAFELLREAQEAAIAAGEALDRCGGAPGCEFEPLATLQRLADAAQQAREAHGAAMAVVREVSP